MNLRIIKRCLLAATAIALAAPGVAAADDGQAPAAGRCVGYFSNAAPAQELRGFLGGEGGSSTLSAGLGDQGLLEFASAPGSRIALVEERGAVCATLAGPLAVRGDTPALFDVPVRWLYEADGLVSGQSFKELGQTFTADSTELDKVACAVVTEGGTFDVVVRRDGPAGEQIGSAASFTTGAPGEWGVARWMPGEVLLEVGKTYYLGIRNRSGEPFGIGMHSTGDVYPGGCAYYDGASEPCSDLALLISLQRDDAVRSTVLYARNDEGWVLHSKGVYFRARSANARAVCVQMRFRNSPEKIDAAIRLYRLMPDASIVKIAPEKFCREVARDGDQFYLAALYGPEEAPLEEGKVYYAEVVPRGFGLPEDEAQLPKRDLLVRIYGETTPGMAPVIFNQRITGVERTAVKLAWEGAADCDVRIHYGLTPYKLDYTISVPKGQQEAAIRPIRPGLTFCFRLSATSLAGCRFETPVYQARTLDMDHKHVTDPPLPAPPRSGLLSLAPMDWLIQPPIPEVSVISEAPVQNQDFESGLNGWQVSDPQRVSCSQKAQSGVSAAGWDNAPAGPRAPESPADDVIYQTVDVTPGRIYMLSAYLYTEQGGSDSAAQLRMPTGDIRARLVCDPAGGSDFSGANSTQWFRTGGKWIRFARKWKATSDRMTIGVGLERGQCWPVTVALADNIRLVEVKE